MINYKITVATGDEITAGTINTIYIVLVGANGETTKHKLDQWGRDFIPGAVDEYRVDSKDDIGEILCVRLYKEYFLTSDDWFCKYVMVTLLGGDLYHFPCYQWLSGTTTMEIPEGKGKILVGDIHPVIKEQRQIELCAKSNTHRWRLYADGAPHCIHVDKISDLLLSDQLTATKMTGLLITREISEIEIKLKGFADCKDSWRNLTDMQRVFYLIKTPNSEIISAKWQLDSFFGYQYLNGVNPTQIHKLAKIPDNFPVTDRMVATSLWTSTLQAELDNGNLFLADYKILEGIPANTINGKQQYITAPLCLLWKSPKNQILPLAIQLSQTPGKDIPIFLPSDSEWDWTLAKMWVRNADFQVHNSVTHFLNTHLFAEVFSIATTRQLPMGHPVHKLLIPHFRYTLAINTIARQVLFNSKGKYDEISSTGKVGFDLLMKKAMRSLTYHSLCLPKDIKHRGVESIPNYFYREDGMKIWLAIERFVSDIVHYYYADDNVVSQDPELQAWVEEIYREGFLENEHSGIPSSLKTQIGLIRYLTMVIFTCSAKHAAVNSGQYDFYSWMPSTPSSMRKPPPKEKGTTTLESVLETLPQVNTTATAMSLAWLLSKEPRDLRPLGDYPDKHFTEDLPKKSIADLQKLLAEISTQIKARNETKRVTYPYLNPEKIDNSVTI